jgi:cytochrome b subunit of formate dehydrogenase
MSWFTESNRWKHFVYAIPVGYVFTILCVLGLATGMEFKDKLWGGKYDWIDWLATMLGGLIGQALQILTIYLII